ncbi:MAG: UPF0280 family protein [Candidatus Omnitrophota bacterium]
MKQNRYQKRVYRHWIKSGDFIKTHVVIEQTDLLILSKTCLDLKFIKQRIGCLRQDIKDYIIQDKRFKDSLKPIAIELNAPPIIKMMSEASKACNVGPMAVVAGSIAQLLARDLEDRGHTELIIENGGDIYLSKQKKNRSIAIFAGKSKFSGKLNLLVKASQTPCGICASSATFGHSLSFGNADSVVIFAKSAALADAVATATCNLVKSKNDFKTGIDFAKKIPQVFGAVIILEDHLVTWGNIEIKNFRRGNKRI